MDVTIAARLLTAQSIYALKENEYLCHDFVIDDNNFCVEICGMCFNKKCADWECVIRHVSNKIRMDNKSIHMRNSGCNYGKMYDAYRVKRRIRLNGITLVSGNDENFDTYVAITKNMGVIEMKNLLMMIVSLLKCPDSRTTQYDRVYAMFKSNIEILKWWR